MMAFIQREKSARAQAMSPLQRLLAGPRLFDAFLKRHALLIKHLQPDATEQQVREQLMQRVAQIHAKDRPDEHA